MTRKRKEIGLTGVEVQELSSQGHSQREIAQMLQISSGTVNKDLFILRQQDKDNIKKYIDERLPEEYEKCHVSINMIKKEECYSMKLDLLTNATVVDDAIRFVSQKFKETTIKTRAERILILL